VTIPFVSAGIMNVRRRRVRRVSRFILLGLATVLTGAWPAGAQSVVGSKHDLGKPTAGANYQPCAYCHTPHNANTSLGAPLWNRTIGSDVSFLAYQSGTLDSPCPATPSPITLACLGCHDDVNAGGGGGMIPGGDKHALVNPFNGPSQAAAWNNTNCLRCHQGHMSGQTRGIRIVGIDLRNDHPVSMTYPTSAQDPEFLTPPDTQRGWGPLASDLKLYDGKVECPTCHNVHNPAIRPFLRKTNANDQLCKTCHLK